MYNETSKYSTKTNCNETIEQDRANKLHKNNVDMLNLIMLLNAPTNLKVKLTQSICFHRKKEIFYATLLYPKNLV